jgi:hypothetical protein
MIGSSDHLAQPLVRNGAWSALQAFELYVYYIKFTAIVGDGGFLPLFNNWM